MAERRAETLGVKNNANALGQDLPGIKIELEPELQLFIVGLTSFQILLLARKFYRWAKILFVFLDSRAEPPEHCGPRPLQPRRLARQPSGPSAAAAACPASAHQAKPSQTPPGSESLCWMIGV